MPAPLSPEQLAEASKRLDKLTQSLEDTILEDICRRIAKAGAVTDTAEYQLMRLKEMGYANSFIEKAIADYMQKSEAEIRQLFFEAAQVSSDFYEKYYMQNGKAAVPLEDNEYMQQLISAGIEQTKGELNNFTQSMGFAVKQPDGSLKFQPVAKAYQSCLDLAHSQVATGVFDYNTAIRNATAALTAKGLQFVDYASGHRNRADVAVRRAILTGIGQMAARVAEKTMDDLGTEYVEVTAHAGARPDHAKWQGRIYHWDRKNNAAANTEKVLDNGGGSGIIKKSVKDRINEYYEENKIFNYSPEDIENELLKSDIGKHISQVIMDKNIKIDFNYSKFDLFDDAVTYGETRGNNITVYPNNHKSISELVKTIIHETTHIELDTEVFTQKEEVYCRLQELKHQKSSYTVSDIRKIISEVKRISEYNTLKWRDVHGI